MRKCFEVSVLEKKKRFRLISRLSLNLCSVVLSKFFLHTLQTGLGTISGLNVLLYPDECFFEGVETGGVEHFLLDFGGVRTPRHEEQFLLLALLGGALALVCVFKVVEAVPALGLSALGQVVEEVVVGGGSVAHRLHRDRLLLFDDVDDVTMNLALLHLVEGILACLADCYPGSHD